MAGLQGLEEQYGDQGLRVLGFFSNDFGGQGGSASQIEQCNSDYGVTFMQFVIAPVVGANARPVFSWILSQPDPMNEPIALAPDWNFHKYLISRDGELVAHFDQQTYMGDSPAAPGWSTHAIVQAVEAELAK